MITRRYDTLSIEDVARFPRPATVVPSRIAFTPDSKAITYLFSEEGSLVLSLWRYDLASGERRVLAGPPPTSTDERNLTLEEELKRERARLRELGVTSYHFAKNAAEPTLLVPAGRLYVAVGDEGLRALPESERAIDARLDNQGRRVAFVRDNELHVLDLVGGEQRRLTFDAEEGVTNGLAEFIAQEELDRDEGFWWSEDGCRLAFERADSRHIAEYTVVHQGRAAIEVERHRYPFAGGANARVQLGVVSVDGGTPTWMDLGPDEDIYLARVGWGPDGVLTASILSRDQRKLRLLSFDSETGRSALIFEEEGEPWFNLDRDLRFLKSGEILCSSERSGYRHLYLRDASGRDLRTLTAGAWMVTQLVHVDEERRLAFFSGTRESVLERHLYAVSLDGGEVRRLTEAPGWHSCVVSPDGERFVDVCSTLGQGPVVEVHRVAGGEAATIFANTGGAAAELALEAPELFTFQADEGTHLHGALYRPPTPTPPAGYPLVVSVYGGPHAQRVADEWSLTVDLRAQYLARAGYAVLKVDNRGSANRGLAFESHLNRRLGTVELADQVAAVRHLAALGDVDPLRVGIYGWSYGGYLACLAMLRFPNVFRVGVAGAPVTDWDGYDTAYTERYMGAPRENPEGYHEGSVLTHVSKLEGRLLLVHGMVDENVHFRHTARLLVALAAAQKSCDLLIFPEERHMPRDAKGLEYQERRVIEYFLSNLHV